MADTKEPGSRDSTGKFLAGYSGNLSGRKRLCEQDRYMLECAAPIAIKVYVDGLAAFRETGHPDYAERRFCATAILERLYGKPAQAITGEDGGPVQVEAAQILGSLAKLTEGG